MKTTTISNSTAAKSGKKDNRVADALNLVLADSYALMCLTHQAHWNVEGSDFFQLHKAFQEQYENLFEAIDEIAEHVRTLDQYAVGGLSKLASMAEMDEFTTQVSQKDYVVGLVLAHEKLVEDALQAQEISEDAGELEAQDLMVERVAWHKKTIWMLKSYLKQP